MEEHRLRPLLAPRSIALVGASTRPGSVSNMTVDTLVRSGYAGEVTLINPKYQEISGYVCLPALDALDSPVDMAILGVGSHNLEDVFEQAVTAKARSLVIFDGCYLDGEEPPLLLERLRRRAHETGIPVMGGNGMRFYNFDTNCHASFYPVGERKAGGITMVAHSGSVATVLGFNDPRYRFNLLISSGQEIGASVADYVDYALTVPSTRVIVLFMETARDPPGLVVALQRAAEHDIPVICKVGRTEKISRLALSHTGALTGSDDAFAAAVRRAGAIKVDDIDEMMSTAALLANGRRPGSGGFASVTDSGGLRELAIDLAHEMNVEYATLSPETHNALRTALPDILPVSNPLDAAGPLDEGFVQVFANALSIMAGDKSVAVLGFETDVRDDFIYNQQIFDIARNLSDTTDKPVVFFSSFADVYNRGIADEFMDRGIPVIGGLRRTLAAVKNTLLRRDLLHHSELEKANPPERLPISNTIEATRVALSRGESLDEAASLELLQQAGVTTVRFERHENLAATIEAANCLGYPVVLKTAEAGQLHKTDARGVSLDLPNDLALSTAYADLQSRLGPAVIVAEMITSGVELAFGCVDDPDYGPLVSVSAGGALVELLADRAFALAPFGPTSALNLITSLKMARLLDGYRGRPAVSMDRLAEALSKFSVLCAALKGCFTEIDVNPVIVGTDHAIAVDALIIGTSR